ncbi:carbohydrate porin [Succinivibrio dextrinosolvens]|uniref:carbohydrate porin n=1 Tax=Succinivibrio dextrinosolvens TaxID=83771 RepID=UPI002478C42B|nr:carbohydrate porin [Succinivibrio dextrinosolvens]
MKKVNKLAAAVALATVGMTFSANAADTTVAVHGMIKSGTNWVADDGLRRGGHGLIGINEEGYFHAFGNEAVHKVQINPTVTYTGDDGVYARAEMIFSHENYDNDDWDVNKNAGGGFRRAVVYLGGFDWNPSTEFWGGKTKDAAGSIFTGSYDTGYVEDYGVGGGFQNMDISFAKWDLNIISFDSDNDPKTPKDAGVTNKKGAPTATGITTWLHGIADTGLDFYFRQVTNSQDKGENDTFAKTGFQTALVYNTPGFLWFGEGFSKIIAQHGKNAGAAPKLAGAYYGVNQGQYFNRFAIDGAWNISKDLSVLSMLFLQHDHYDQDANRDFIAVSVRPSYQVSPHVNLQFEIAYEHANYNGKNVENRKDKAFKGNYDCIKLTIAPTFQLGQGIWGSPSIQPYVTYGRWNRKAADDGLFRGDGVYTTTSKANLLDTSTWIVGIQAQAYF